MKDAIHNLLPEIINIRQKIHAKPELGYEEIATSQLVIGTLKKFGYEVKTGIGKTGVTAVLDSGKPGKTVALRADMDALALQEKTNLSYQSQYDGKMHACGHDGHTATLLAVAGALKKSISLFKGKIKFIFQPAEEGRAGAAVMIKDGVLEDPKVDAIFGYHNHPALKLGTVTTKDGCLMAGMDTFAITVKGKGGHAAEPHKTIDPIFMGSLIVQALQSIASRVTSPNIPIVLSITEFHGGTAINVIPDEIVLRGSLRTTASKTQIMAKQKMIEIIEGIAKSFGAKVIINFLQSFPPTINHSAETELVLNTTQILYGDMHASELLEPYMWSEDFSYFLEKIPGCFFFVGGGNNNMALHSPEYNFNDEILSIAAEIMGQVAINYLNQF